MGPAAKSATLCGPGAGRCDARRWAASHQASKISGRITSHIKDTKERDTMFGRWVRQFAEELHEAVADLCREVDEVTAFCRESNARILKMEADARARRTECEHG